MDVISRLAKSFDLDCKKMSWTQFIVATKKEKIIGFGRLRQYPDFTELATVGVIQQERGKGVGSYLVNALTNRGPQSIYVTCVIPDFFGRLGFKKVATFPLILQKKVDFCKLYGFKDGEIFVMKIEKKNS